MRFIGSAAVALIILYVADQFLNDGRFTGVTIDAARQVLALAGIHL
jgi:hypothetical protein